MMSLILVVMAAERPLFFDRTDPQFDGDAKVDYYAVQDLLPIMCPTTSLLCTTGPPDRVRNQGLGILQLLSMLLPALASSSHGCASLFS